MARLDPANLGTVHLLSAVVLLNATSEQIEIVTFHSRISYLPDFVKRTSRSTVKDRATFLDFKSLTSFV